MACETYCLDDDDAFLEATVTLNPELTASTVRFVDTKADIICSALTKCHSKKVNLAIVI